MINFSSSSQYHRCAQCFMKFSSISRLLNHTQKNDCIKITYKHCEQKFNSNNKFHEHVRLHHNQKNDDYKFVTFTSKIIIMKSNVSITFFATFRFSISLFKLIKQLNIASFISSFTFESMSTIFKFSFHSIIMIKASMICSLCSRKNNSEKT